MRGDQITQTYTFLPHISLVGSLRATARNCLDFANKFTHTPLIKTGLADGAVSTWIHQSCHRTKTGLASWMANLGSVFLVCSHWASVWTSFIYCGLWEFRHCNCLTTWVRLPLESDGRNSIPGWRESDGVMLHFCLLRNGRNLSSPFCHLGRRQCLICALLVKAFCQVWIMYQCASVVNSLVFVKWQLFRQYLTPSSVIT